MDNSPNLALPYILPSQAQKHVTHNEALRVLDAVVQLAVLDRNLSAAPATPAKGDRHIVAAGAAGVWAGQDGKVAAWQDGGWVFFAPRPGWLCFVVAESRLLHWTGGVWEEIASTLSALQNLALLGLGTTADSENRFAAKLNKALWAALPTGEGGNGDLRYTLNKQSAANVLSLLMQSNWSGRAEIGLVGKDDLSLRVSADGASWREALAVNRNDGKLAVGESFMNFSALNIKGRALTGTAAGWFGITVTNTDADNTNKGGAVLTGAPYANANKPFMVLGPWATSNGHMIYYGGGGWGVPDATQHLFYAGAYQPATDNTATLALTILSTAVTSHRPLLPGADNAYSLGNASYRWSVVHAATGTINTSDARLKRDIAPVPLGLAFVRDLKPVAYRWKTGEHAIVQERVPDPLPKDGEQRQITLDRAIAKPGRRVHYGLLAQQVKATLDAHGVTDFAGWTLADKDDPDSEQGLRYDQFVPILVRAVQELAAEVGRLRGDV